MVQAIQKLQQHKLLKVTCSKAIIYYDCTKSYKSETFIVKNIFPKIHRDESLY